MIELVSTIQVQDTTLTKLKQLRKVKNAKNYDELIVELMQQERKSMYGASAHGKKYAMKDILRGLRDERDRV